MASIPLKTITNLYATARRNPRKWMYAGRSYCARYDNGDFELLHYGTPILRVDENKYKYTIGRGAWSASDRDAINSIFHLLGVGVRAHVHYGDISVEEGMTVWTEKVVEGYRKRNYLYPLSIGGYRQQQHGGRKMTNVMELNDETKSAILTMTEATVKMWESMPKEHREELYHDSIEFFAGSMLLSAGKELLENLLGISEEEDE